MADWTAANESTPETLAAWKRRQLASPLGSLTLVVDGLQRLRALYWTKHAAKAEAGLQRQSKYGGQLLKEGLAGVDPFEVLAAYFEGEDRLSQIPLMVGGSPFQRRVWGALVEISAHQPISYARLAAMIGQPGAARAVGLANRANPIPIVIPCHRVISSDGAIGGYSGGIQHKRWLLDHERRWTARTINEGDLG